MLGDFLEELLADILVQLENTSGQIYVRICLVFLIATSG